MRIVSRFTLLGALSALAIASAPAQNAAPAQAANAKGRLITPADIKNWNALRQNLLSNDGKWFAYVVGATDREDTLFVRGTAKDAPLTRVGLGTGGGSVAMSGDSKWIGYIVGPPRPAGGAAGRGGRAGGGRGRGGAPGGGAPGDAQAADTSAGPSTSSTFWLMNLATGEKKSFPRIRRFGFNGDSATWIAMLGYPVGAPPAAAAAAAPAGGRGGRGGPPAASGGAESGAGANLLLYKIGSTDGPVQHGRGLPVFVRRGR